MESELDNILQNVKHALERFEGPLEEELNSFLRLCKDGPPQSSILRTKVQETMQHLDKLQRILTPPQLTLVEGVFAFTDSKVLLCATRHRLADHVHAQPLTIPELASAANVQEDGLKQIMRYLHEMGFFTLDRATGKISNNRVSELLRQDHWTTWCNWVDLYAGEHYDILTRLPDQLAADQPHCAAQLFYGTDKSVYEYLAEKGLTAMFHKAIGSVSVAESPGLLRDYPWDEVKAETIMDVGAGAGDFISHYLRHFPSATAAAFELPQTAEIIRRRFDAEAELAPRLLDVHSGDFFADPIPGYSVYFLKWVLHNWDDEHCVQLLRSLRDAIMLKPGVSRVLVVETVLLDGRLGRCARYADIRMLSRNKSRERTFEDYQRLAKEGGFEIHGMITPRGCLTQVLDLRPVL